MKSSLSFQAIAIVAAVVILTTNNNTAVAFADNYHADISPPPPSYINIPHPLNLILPPPINLYNPVVNVVGKVYCYRCSNQQNPAQSNDKHPLQGTYMTWYC
jgi:hypothetical protein